MVEGAKKTLVFRLVLVIFCVVNHNKHFMRYSELLQGSMIIDLPLNISEKLYWQYLFKKLEGAETHRLPLCYDNTIPTNPEEQHPSFKQMGIITIFSFGYQSCAWPPSGLFCWQNPCSGCNSGIDLVFALEYTFFQLCLNMKQIS